MSVLSVVEYRIIAACVLKAPTDLYMQAVPVMTKLFDVTDWSTDPKFDEFKEQPPCQTK